MFIWVLDDALKEKEKLKMIASSIDMLHVVVVHPNQN